MKKLLTYFLIFLISSFATFILIGYIVGSAVSCMISFGCSGGSSNVVLIVLYFSFIALLVLFSKKVLKVSVKKSLLVALLPPLLTISFFISINYFDKYKDNYDYQKQYSLAIQEYPYIHFGSAYNEFKDNPGPYKKNRPFIMDLIVPVQIDQPIHLGSVFLVLKHPQNVLKSRKGDIAYVADCDVYLEDSGYDYYVIHDSVGQQIDKQTQILLNPGNYYITHSYYLGTKTYYSEPKNVPKTCAQSDMNFDYKVSPDVVRKKTLEEIQSKYEYDLN